MSRYLVTYPALWHDDTQEGFKSVKDLLEKKIVNNSVFGLTITNVLRKMGRVTGQDVMLVFDYKPIDDRSTEVIIIACAIGKPGIDIITPLATFMKNRLMKQLQKENRHFTITEIK